jgi:hypothetical protein
LLDEIRTAVGEGYWGATEHNGELSITFLVDQTVMLEQLQKEPLDG